jgi:hypothetical protein
VNEAAVPSVFSLQPAFLTMKAMKKHEGEICGRIGFLGVLASLRLCVIPQRRFLQPSARFSHHEGHEEHEEKICENL